MAREVIEKWTFGKPVLEAGGKGRASWSKALLADSERGNWSVRLDAGVQTSWDDYAKVVIPVNEMAFHLLKSVRLQAYYTATSGIDMGVCVYLHNPKNLDDRVEISHTPYTTSAAGWRELNFPTEPGGTSWFYYGTVAGTPDTCPTAGTAYTWQNFQDDNIFGNWTIYKITLDYGYYTGDGTMDGCYLAKAFINGDSIPLVPTRDDLEAPVFQYHTGAAAIATALVPLTPFRLLRIELHLNAAATQQTFTATVDAGKTATVYDTLLISEAMSGITDLVKTFGEGFEYQADDEIDCAWTNTDTKTYGLTYVWRVLP